MNLPPKRQFQPEFEKTFTNEYGEEFKIWYKSHLLDDFYPEPRPLKEYEPAALQTWLDNMGESVYNPITFIVTPSKKRTKDGRHRRVAMRLLKLPVRILAIELPDDRGLTIGERRVWVQHFEVQRKDSIKIENHFMNMPAGRMRKMAGARFYPRIIPVRPIFNKSPFERAIAYGLPRGWTMEQICKSVKKHKWRWIIPELIMEDVDVKDKTILDVGSGLGYHTMILLEHGAEGATCITGRNREVKKIKYLKNYRKYNIDAVQDRIQHMIAHLGHYDIVLCLNMFHHVLKQTKEGWAVFDRLLDKGDKVYLSMGTTWGVLEPWNNDVEHAFKSNIKECKLTELGHTQYRGRKLYRVERR
jgi:hypothetical protein